MRLVGIGYRPNFRTKTHDDTNDIANEVMRIMGTNASLSGKEFIFVEGMASTDTVSLLEEEYEGNERVKKYSLDIAAFAIEYTITQTQLGNNC